MSSSDVPLSSASGSSFTSLLGGARIDHISIVVRDLDKAIAHYQVMYPGPFRRFDYRNDALIYGKPASYSLKMAVGKIAAALDVEIIQVSGGTHPIHERFLEERGEGVEHVAYQVDDLEASVRAFAEAGFPVILERADGTGSAVYIDTTSVGGLITELIRSGYTLDVAARAIP